MNMDDIRERLISVFEINGYFLPINSDSNEDINITDFDISSLDFISIMIGIEEEFGFNIPDDRLSLELFNSFNGLLEFVAGIVASQHNET